MAALTLTRETYRDKVYGGWLGKNAGGTLGNPVEGRKEPLSLTFYDPIPGQAAWNEDLDFQLVWLDALRRHGPEITSTQLAEAWQAHITYPWDEYGYAMYNLRRGLMPPITGSFNNWFRQSDGGAIRCEIWGMVTPGAPQAAASFAYRDAMLDHATEGVWAAMFRAAMVSAAFFISDPQQLLDIGLAMVPSTCRTARAVTTVRSAVRDRTAAVEARRRVIEAVGADNYTDAPQNNGFLALGLLYGAGDFGASLCAAANCGYDADGNAGTLGALLGIIGGKSSLPARWLDPIGDSVVLGWGVVDVDVERTTAELTSHTIEAGERVIAACCPDVALVDAAEMPASPNAPPDTTEAALLPAAEEPVAGVPTPSAEEPRRTTFAVPDLESPAESGLPAAPIIETPDELTAQQAGSPTEPAAPDSDSAAAAPAAADAAGVTPGVGADQAVAGPLDIPAPAPGPSTPPISAVNWTDNALVKPLLVAPPNTAILRAGQFELTVDYGEVGPALVPNAATSFTVAIRNLAETDFMGHVTLTAPSGWQVAVPGAQGQRQHLAPGGMARYGFVVRVPDNVALPSHSAVTIVMTPENGPATTTDVGFLSGSCWWFVGPFQNMGDTGFDKAYPVEDRSDFEDDYLGRAGGLIKWQKLAFRENVIPLEEIFTGIAGVAYGVTTVHVPAQTEARIIAHTNDGVKVWVNRQRVAQRHSHEPFRPTLGYGPLQADVVFQPGDNQVMVKVVRCGDPIQFAFAIADRSGQPMLDVIGRGW